MANVISQINRQITCTLQVDRLAEKPQRKTGFFNTATREAASSIKTAYRSFGPLLFTLGMCIPELRVRKQQIPLNAMHVILHKASTHYWLSFARSWNCGFKRASLIEEIDPHDVFSRITKRLRQWLY